MNKLSRIIKVIVITAAMVILVIVLVDYSKILIPRQQRQEITQKFIIPPEFMSGDTLYLGDSFERVSKYIKMEQFWYSDGWSRGKKYQAGYYWGNRGIGHLQFNYQNKLTKLDLAVTNRDSILPKQFFDKTAKVMIKYYGNNFKMYNRSSFKSVRILFWNLSDSNTVYYYGHINTDDLNGEDSNTVFVEYNDFLPKEQYPLNTTETAKDLGLE